MMSVAAVADAALGVERLPRRGLLEEYVYGAQDNLTKESEDLTAIFDDTFPLAYNHTSVYEAKKVITYQLIYKQPFASTAFYLPLAVIGAQFFFGIVLRRIGQYWEVGSPPSRRCTACGRPSPSVPLPLPRAARSRSHVARHGDRPLPAHVRRDVHAVRADQHVPAVGRSASMGRFVFFFVLRVAMYASHVLLIKGGVQWVYALNLDDIDPPLAVNYAARASRTCDRRDLLHLDRLVAVSAASARFLLSCLAGSINTGYGNAE